MKLSSKLEAAFNDQILIEFESVYAYLQMAADFDFDNWTGFATWMKAQSQEEWMHATKFTNFVLQRGGAVRLQALPAPRSGISTPLEAFERALEHEKKVSQSIHHLYQAAMAENDFSSLPLLQWFVNEQVEEEDTVNTIVERMRRVGNDNTGLLLLDRELASRPAGGAVGATSIVGGR